MIPKFRVWDIDEEEMLYTEESLVVYFCDAGIVATEPKNPNKFFIDIENFELMQSTGLKDINGKEIYIGDLVKCDLNINDTIDERVYEVVDNGFELILEHVFTAWHLSECINSVEVIGNIHQNPNLLEADSHER